MAQKYTEARKEGNRRWDTANLDRISVALPKGQKEIIKAHAESRGESVNGFVQRAIQETMERDNPDAIRKAGFRITDTNAKAMVYSTDGRLVCNETRNFRGIPSMEEVLKKLQIEEAVSRIELIFAVDVLEQGKADGPFEVKFPRRQVEIVYCPPEKDASIFLMDLTCENSTITGGTKL